MLYPRTKTAGRTSFQTISGNDQDQRMGARFGVVETTDGRNPHTAIDRFDQGSLTLFGIVPVEWLAPRIVRGFRWKQGRHDATRMLRVLRSQCPPQSRPMSKCFFHWYRVAGSPADAAPYARSPWPDS